MRLNEDQQAKVTEAGNMVRSGLIADRRAKQVVAELVAIIEDLTTPADAGPQRVVEDGDIRGGDTDVDGADPVDAGDAGDAGDGGDGGDDEGGLAS